MNEKLIKWATDILEREVAAKLYGAVTIKFEAGKITCVKIEKTEKPNAID